MPPDDELLYLDIGGIDNSVNKVKSHKTYTWGEAPSRAQQIVQVGDTLFSTVRTYLRNIAKIDNKLYSGQIASSGFTVLRPKSDMLNENYLFYYTLSTPFLNSLSKLQTGSSYPAVRDKDVFAQKIPLPPLPEQRAIVAKLERLFTELDRSVAELEAARAKVGVYRQSVLREAFAGRLTGESGIGIQQVKYVDFEDYLENIEAGKSFKCTERPPNFDEVGVAKVSAVSWGRYQEEESKTTHDPSKINPAYFIKAGDFLMSRANTIELVGACVIVESTTKRIMLSDKTLRLHFRRGVPAFFKYYLRSQRGRQEIESKSSGNQASMRNIGQRRIMSIQVPVFSESMQALIVEAIEYRFSLADHLERTIEESLVRARGLRQGVLKRAFAGELV